MTGIILVTCTGIILYISHLCILLYYNKWDITVIYSLPEGYKGIYDPYIPPSGNHSDQSESPFLMLHTWSILHFKYAYSSWYCYVVLHTQYTHRQHQTVDIVYTDTLIDTKQEAISYRSIYPRGKFSLMLSTVQVLASTVS